MTPQLRLMSLPCPALLASLALVIAGVQAQAQEQTARLVKDANRGPGDFRAGIQWVVPAGNGVVFPQETLASGAELWFSDGTAAGTWSLNPPLESGGRARFTGPHGFVASGRWCYFIANEYEVWRSDGTPEGTAVVASFTGRTPNQIAVGGGRVFAECGLTVYEEMQDFYVRELWCFPMDGGAPVQLGPPGEELWFGIGDMTMLGGTAFFSADDEFHTRELWVSDGTAAGTRRLAAAPGEDALPVIAGKKVPWRGAMYFPAQRQDGRYELWRSDGTDGGTRRVFAFPAGSGYVWTYDVPATGDYLHFFVDEDSSNKYEIWRTQGDAASTRAVRGAPVTSFPSEGPVLADTASGVFLAAAHQPTQAALWRLRGKAAGAVRLTRPEKSTGSGIPVAPVDSLPYEMLDGSLLEFVDTGNARELWRMNPQGKGARAIWKAPLAVVDYSTLGFRGMMPGGRAIFSYDDGGGVRQVWITDGTRRGTRLLGDHGTGKGEGYPFDFEVVGGMCFYSVYQAEDTPTSTLWKTDGTPAGTMKIVAADGTTPSPDLHEMVAYDGGVAFLTNADYQKPVLWRSDGTTAGTVKVKNAFYGPTTGAEAKSLSVAGGKLFFAVNGPLTQQLWESDGTTAGTVPASPAVNFARDTISPALDLGGVAVFQARQAIDVHQWWRHSGTDTRRVRESYEPGQQLYGWTPGSRRQVVAGTRLFYCGIGQDDYELWLTDGTDAGTRRVKDIFPGSLSSSPDQFVAVGDTVYFTAYDEDHGNELWRSDGTEAGTVLVADIDPGPADSWPAGLKVMGGKLYFHAQRRDVGRELFMIDLALPGK